MKENHTISSFLLHKRKIKCIFQNLSETLKYSYRHIRYGVYFGHYLEGNYCMKYINRFQNFAN